MIGTLRSFKILLSQATSHTVTTAPLYWVSMIESATVGCFLVLQEIALLPGKKTKPDVDRLSAL